MSEQFDPYHKWLAIPPQEQPPHCYRLLGIAEFEDDADVIDAAANQRMSYLQDMAAGPHMAESQRLLNEISAARLQLLNPETKAQYDAELRMQFQPAGGEPASGSPEAAENQSGSAPTASHPSVHLNSVIVSASIGVVAVLIAVGLFIKGTGGSGGREEEQTAALAHLKVKWKLDERDGAYVMIDSDMRISSPDALGANEVVIFDVDPGDHQVTFERMGHRKIPFRYRFLPGETKTLELRWRPR